MKKNTLTSEDPRVVKIYNELCKRFAANSYNPIQITMKTNGDVLTLTPCSYCPEITKKEQIEYVLVYGQMNNMTAKQMGGDLMEVSVQIASYDEIIEYAVDQVAKLKEFCRTHKNSKNPDDYQYYSDWHKDIFCFRPNGWVVGESRNGTVVAV